MRKILLCTILLVSFLFTVQAFADEMPKEDENIKIDYTDYGITLDEAVDIQLRANATPISDKYKNEPAYISVKSTTFVNPFISVDIADVRITPSIKGEVIFQFPKNVPIHITSIVNEKFNTIEYESFNGLPIPFMKVKKDETNRWYEIIYKRDKYYIALNEVTANKVRALSDTNVYQSPTKQSHLFGNIHKGEVVTVNEPGTKWHQIEYKSWRIPKKADIKRYIDPKGEGEELFQHIRLDETIGVPADDLNRLLAGKGILEGLGEAFITGGKEHGLNEAYLISHAFLETGLGTSELAKGVEVGMDEDKNLTVVTETNRANLKKIKKVYNMFGIGAVDSCPIECGAKAAYENKWFSPEKAVEDGARWIGKDYIYNEFSQNTLYKMKWNPKMSEGQQWKQYATDIEWARKQTKRMKEIYDELNDPIYYYDVPLYKKK